MLLDGFTLADKFAFVAVNQYFRSAGAYGSSMASNYNTRNRAAEVLVIGGGYKLIRRRETLEQQMANELAYL